MNEEDLNRKFGVTDEQLERWAQQFESGEWPEGVTVPVGRPRLADEDVLPVTFKLPVSKIIALDAKAFERGGTRSQVLREAVDEYLKQA